MNVDIRVVPGAKKQEIKRDGQSLKIKLVSRAQEGKANRELVDYLASIFSVRKSEVRIVSGERGRKKVVFLPVDRDRLDTIMICLTFSG
jgi:uncharacterized protein (TIGR00251 family)